MVCSREPSFPSGSVSLLFFFFVLLPVLLMMMAGPCYAQRLQATNQLPNPRYRHTASTVDDRYALFAGGATSSTASPSSTVDVYDAALSAWTTVTMAQGHAHANHAATTVKRRVIIAGGDSAGAIDVFDAGSRGWMTASATLSEPRAELAATSVVVDRSGIAVALFAGGVPAANSSSFTGAVDVYYAHNNTWTTLRPLSVARGYLSATSVGALALFAGGRRAAGSANVVDAVDIYSATNNRWTRSALSEPRELMAAVSLGGQAIFAGGQNASGRASATVDIYHASNNSWTTAKLSVGRWLLAATAIGDVALFAGGVTGFQAYSDVVDVYNVTSGRWTTTTALRVARSRLAATSVGNIAIFAGGENSTGAANPLKAMDIFAVELISNQTSSSAGVDAPVLEFNSTGTAVRLVPRVRGILRTTQTLGIGFNVLNEITSEGAIVQVGSIPSLAAGWRAIQDTTLNASDSFIFASELSLAYPNATPITVGEAPRIEVQFYLFSETKAITVGRNFSFRVDPSFAKFTLTPGFTNFTRIVKADEPGSTTFELVGPDFTSGQPRLRMVDAVEVDGEAVETGGVEYNLDNTTSELVLRFSFFNSSLVYDPDLGVVFGDTGSSDGSSSDTWIIAVAVAVPVACAIVAAVIVTAIVVGIVQKRRLRKGRKDSMISFDGDTL